MEIEAMLLLAAADAAVAATELFGIHFWPWPRIRMDSFIDSSNRNRLQLHDEETQHTVSQFE